MQHIPDALAGLAAYPQFCLYYLSPSTKKPGKFDKFPVDWRSGKTASAHDPAIWTTFDNAIAQVAAGKAHGVGFVFTDNDPFFFVDIDNALQPDGTWSAIANSLCAAFPGAAIEVSQSGRGLHIIGSGANAANPTHRCKNIPLGLEFYTTGRFVALTGTHAVGDVRAEMGTVVQWLEAQYFPPGADVVNSDGWTDGPREDWRGPADDDDLIRRALNSRSAAGVFGSKATFADLWERNVSVLASVYPDSDREFDESQADAALASHLAFWTGCDMERMHRIMQRSALKRDKWEREDYLTRFTIPNAVSVQRDVCKDKEVQVPIHAPTSATGEVTQAVGKVKTGETYFSPQQQMELFAGCVYVQDAHRVLVPSGAMLKPDQFKTMYGGNIYILDNGNEKTTRNAWEAFTESNVNECPKVEGTCFRPELPAGAIVTIDGWRYVNTYTPIAVPRAQGDASPFWNHLAKILPVERDRQILIAYMAACVQHKGVKFQWCPLLQGVEGNGKTLFSRVVANAIGERYTHWPRADQVSSKFNSWLEGKIFIGMEDVYLPEDRGEVWEILKPMITNDRQPVEPKGVDQRSARVCCNFLLNTNHKDAIKKTRNDRRIATFYTAQQEQADLARAGMGGAYFPNLYKWAREGGYAIVAEILNTYAIPDEFNPATDCQIAPDTSTTAQAIEESLGGVEQEIMEQIESGAVGFMGGWISSFFLGKLLDKLGRSRSITHRRRDALLANLGYVKHPGLTGGRVNNTVAPDAGKPILFVKMGTPEAALEGGAEIARAYTVAQGVAFGVV